jgi:glycolate oxidase iron-sulfur subunit
LDSPRGRITLIQDMLENDDAPSEKTVKHLDRCLSCMACKHHCPSGVDYAQLIDHAHEVIAERYQRPFSQRAIRKTLELVLPRPALFRLALVFAYLGKPIARWLPKQIQAMLDLAASPFKRPTAGNWGQTYSQEGVRRGRVVLLPGCAQKVLEPEINAATVRLLNRHGIEVVVPSMVGCCGALTHHLGAIESARASARKVVKSIAKNGWLDDCDAVLVNASGCGTMVKDYGDILSGDELAEDAVKLSKKTRDITEYLGGIELRSASLPRRYVVAYHRACSLHNAQGVGDGPKNLLVKAGFRVLDVPEPHMCCGSAGIYNVIEPEMAEQLRDRKVKNIRKINPDLVAAANIGCITQIAAGASLPTLHPIQLLDWASGGPRPLDLGGPKAAQR